MRARTFRPVVDFLDHRIVLSTTTGAVAAVQDATAPAPPPGDHIDLSGTGTWYVGGNPPVQIYEPTNPPIDLTVAPTTLVTTC